MVMEPMSERTAAVGNCLFCTVLPSANLLVTVGGLSKDQVKRGLRELKEREFVEIHEMGALLPPVPVVAWTERGLDHFEATEWQRGWCGADGLGNLALHDFAKVEAVNAVAPLYATGGWVLQRIRFFERQPMIAAAEYRHPDHHAPAYIIFCWVSMLENQRELFERMRGHRGGHAGRVRGPRQHILARRHRPPGCQRVGCGAGSVPGPCRPRRVGASW